MIYKMNNGKHIDLSKIVMIGELPDSGIVFEFNIECQLLDKPIWINMEPYYSSEGHRKALSDFRLDRTQLIEAWKQYNSKEYLKDKL